MFAICFFTLNAKRKPYVKDDDPAAKEQNDRKILQKSAYVTHFHEISRIYPRDHQIQYRYSQEYDDHDTHYIHHDSTTDSQTSTPL